jgi:hypothetical protein
MGYIPESFSYSVQSWFDAGWLQPGHKLIEFGAQEFYCDPSETTAKVSAFLKCKGLLDDKIDALLANGPPSVGAIYEAIGIRYFSIDVDGAHGSTFFDLNSSAPPSTGKTLSTL